MGLKLYRAKCVRMYTGWAANVLPCVRQKLADFLYLFSFFTGTFLKICNRPNVVTKYTTTPYYLIGVTPQLEWVDWMLSSFIVNQSSSGAGTHRNAVPVPFLTTGTPFRFLFGRTVVQNWGLLALLLS